jgi:hypothetical protein
MTSLLTSSRQVSSDSGYYIPVGSCVDKIFSYNNTTGLVGAAATWATNAQISTAFFVSSAGAGILRDLGKTVVSSGRTFRKVQLVLSTGNTFGVAGTAPTPSIGEDYLTGYIELGFGAAPRGNVAPVAAYGR